MQLQSDTILTYQFDASLSVKFDIHRHLDSDKEKTAVEILESSYGTTHRGPKSIKIKVDGLYCLLWKNRYRSDMELNYKIQFEEQ